VQGIMVLHGWLCLWSSTNDLMLTDGFIVVAAAADLIWQTEAWNLE